MNGLWGKAFWRDSAERTISAVAQSLLLFLTGNALGNAAPDAIEINVDFSDWRVWLAIMGGAALIQMLKNLVAVTANPNSGASFGASVPSDLVRVQTTVTGSHSGALPDDAPVPQPGDSVAGKALADETNIPEGAAVQVTLLPPAV